MKRKQRRRDRSKKQQPAFTADEEAFFAAGESLESVEYEQPKSWFRRLLG
jgi:hypothetical protein